LTCAWVRVATPDELQVNQMKLLHLSDRRVVLARTEKDYVAFDDRCPHKGGSLADGVLAGCVATCPWHVSQFDVRTGAVEAGPAKESVTTYKVEADKGGVRLLMPVTAELVAPWWSHSASTFVRGRIRNVPPARCSGCAAKSA